MKENTSRRAGMSALAAVMTMGTLLAACSGGAGTQGSSGAPGTGDKSSPAAPKERPKITVTQYDRGQIPQGEGDFTKNRWTEWINKNSPVEVEFVVVPRTGEVAKFNTLFASNTAPDLIITYNGDYRNNLYVSKQVIPLDDLIEKNSTNYKKLVGQYSALKKTGVKDDGKNYEIGRVTGLRQHITLLIRNDWLKKLNLDMPKTPEDLLKVSKAFAESDPDGNQKKDTFGFNLSQSGDGIINAIFGSSTWQIDKDGKLYHDFDRAKAALEFKKQLYDSGSVDKDFLADKGGEKAKQDWVNGKLGMYASGKGTSDLPLYQTLKKNNPNAEVVPLQLPAGPFGHFGPEVDVPAGTVAMINANAKNPAAVMQYVDWLISEPTLRTLKYGFEGEHWKKGKNGCPEPIDREKNKKELDWNYDYWTPLGSTIFLGACNEPTSSLDLDDPLQKELANIYEMGKKAYIDKSRPVYSDIGFLPPLPKELTLVSSNGFKYLELLQKAIVSGSSYTAEQAIKESKDVWEKSGGAQVDQYYTKYFQDNKDKAYISKVDSYAGY
ncbi:extracellular solute-binding protein [Paenibacillus hodogayensis]|uniref:Extracellular solute-binding protein n=1 Tax=Paenibacillus hodogayensis TaxID=279208 RepID=A0ABV5VRR6_9BACL